MEGLLGGMLIGLMIGGSVGFLLAAVLQVAKKADISYLKEGEYYEEEELINIYYERVKEIEEEIESLEARREILFEKIDQLQER